MTKIAIKKGQNKPKNKQPTRTSQSKTVPVAYGVTARSSGPNINGKDGIRIRRCEFVGTASNGAVTGFALTPLSTSTPGYDLNPSSPNLFPWLSRIAPNYERFRFESIKLKFVPSQATTTAGRFYAAVDYDYDDAPANSKITMMGNSTAVECPVWQEVTMSLDSKSLNRDLPFRYVNSTTKGLAVEERTAFSGFVMLAFDTTVANLLMDIWIEYDVTFVTPVNDDAIIQQMLPDATGMNAVTNITVATGGGFAGIIPKSKLVAPAGPIKPVVASTGSVPQFLVPYGATTVDALNGYDISGAKGMGILAMLTSWFVTGQTPAGMLALSQGPKWHAFDYLGNALGDITSVVSSLYQSGAYVPSAVSTASATLYDIHTYDLHQLLDLYPTIRYIAGILTNITNPAGAGSIASGFKWSS